jgi:large subunit ribosomal protein L28
VPAGLSAGPGPRPTQRFNTSVSTKDPIMAAVCDICGKHPGFGMSVSFSHKRNPRRWNPNIQRIKILEGRTPRRRNVCTSCIKANKVRRAV